MARYEQHLAQVFNLSGVSCGETDTRGPPVKARSDELQIFVSVIECGSISAAAEQVGQTPSAVSRTLSRLEANSTPR